MLRILFAFAILVLPAAAIADDGDTRSGTVAEVVDGDTLILEDGREIRLVGIQAPKLALGRPEFVEWPLADDARRALQDLTLGKTVSLEFSGRRLDRNGRWLAHLYDSDGTWIQGAILEQGMARIYTFADQQAAPIDPMLARERAARAAGRGIWAHPYYAIRAPEHVADDVGTFQVVEGRVVDAAIVRGRAYLNFGADYKTDFTITVAPANRRAFEDAGIDLAALTGRRVRARGWIDSYNGPQIDATHPQQLEILD